MITEQQLLERGYKQYRTQYYQSQFSDFFMQKRFIDDGGIKYSLQLVHYPGDSPRNLDPSWMAEVISNRPHFTFQQHWVEDIDLVEQNTERFWSAMGCEYYETYSGA